LRKSLFVGRDNVVVEGTSDFTYGEVTGSKHSDIEDVFDVDDYLALYNAALGQAISSGDLPPGDRIVKRITEKTDSDFEHCDPADYFLRHRDAILPKLSGATLDRFEKLFERINNTVPTTCVTARDA